MGIYYVLKHALLLLWAVLESQRSGVGIFALHREPRVPGRSARPAGTFGRHRRMDDPITGCIHSQDLGAPPAHRAPLEARISGLISRAQGAHQAAVTRPFPG
jgi:hypothetical protein